jgi:hypothetical protein
MLIVADRSVVWNYRWPDGLTARAVIDRVHFTFKLSLFLNDQLRATEEFSNTRDAMRRAEELRLLVASRGRRAEHAS